jgi:hypothetical protein
MSPPDDDTPPLTDDEIKMLREIVQNEQRWKWVYSTLRLWAGWGAAISVFFYATYGFLADLLRGHK